VRERESGIITLGLSGPDPGGPTSCRRKEHVTEWSLEPELAAPVPRAVRLRGDYFVALLSVVFPLALLTWAFLDDLRERPALLWLMAAAWMAMMAWVERLRRRSKVLVQRGVATRGSVVSSRRRDPIRREPGGWSCVVAVEAPQPCYVLAMWGDDVRTRRVGDTVTVLYLPESPEWAMCYADCWYEARVPSKQRDQGVSARHRNVPPFARDPDPA
jgi:hypothetical protein